MNRKYRNYKGDMCNAPAPFNKVLGSYDDMNINWSYDDTHDIYRVNYGLQTDDYHGYEDAMLQYITCIQHYAESLGLL